MTKINLGLHSHQIFGIEMKPESLAQWFISAYKGVAYGRQVSRLGATARRCNAGIRFLERSNSQPWLDNALPLSALAATALFVKSSHIVEEKTKYAYGTRRRP